MGVKCEACQHEHVGWVPADRLSKATAKAKDAETARAEALSRVAELEASTGRVAELEASVAELSGERDALTMQGAMMRAGITDAEGLAVVATLWAAVPEDARPSEGVAGWLTSSDAPRAVRAYLPSEVAPAAPASPAAPSEPAPAAAPSSVSVRPTPPSSAGILTPAQVDAMSPQEYAQWRSANGTAGMYAALSGARSGQG